MAHRIAYVWAASSNALEQRAAPKLSRTTTLRPLLLEKTSPRRSKITAGPTRLLETAPFSSHRLTLFGNKRPPEFEHVVKG